MPVRAAPWSSSPPNYCPLAPNLSLTLLVQPGPRATSSRRHDIALDELHQQPLEALSGVPAAFQGAWTVNITERITSGFVWDVYFGLLRSEGYDIPVVIKLFSPLGYACPYEIDSAIDGMERDVEAINGPLAALQGTSVPRMFGEFALPNTGGMRRIVIQEFCGEMLTEYDDEWLLEDLPQAQKDDVRKLIASVHDAGVLHGDLFPRHILQRQDPRDIIPMPLKAPRELSWGRPGSLVLVDYDQSCLRASKSALAAEAAQLERWLQGIPDIVRSDG